MNLISKEAYIKVQEELKYLLYEKHPKITNDISTARALGDLSENAEYQSARNDQRELIRRVKYLTEIIKKSTQVDLNKIDNTKIHFGVTFSIQNTDNEKIKTWTLLSEYESDINKNIINYQSPLAKTFLNCKVGDIKEFNNIEYEVIEIKNFKY